MGVELLKKGYRDVTIYEKYDYIGGRVVTIKRSDGTTYDIGAGRIHESHGLVMELITRYGLTWGEFQDVAPLYISEYGARAVRNDFEESAMPIFKRLVKEYGNVLGTTTIGRLLCKMLGEEKAHELIDKFPYETEIWKMRADVSLMGFLKGGVMGTREGFGTIKGGLGMLITALKDDFIRLGGKIVTEWTLREVREDGAVIGVYNGREETIRGMPVILALHVNALKAVKGVGDKIDALRWIDMAPLVRIYGKWGAGDGGGKPWFSKLPKIVTSTPERYIIPVNPDAGLLMASYTDGEDTSAWMSRAARCEPRMHVGWEKMLMRGLRSLFPDRNIPEPEWLRAYPWTDGTSYWIPGDYSPDVAALSIMFPPINDVYICGESISVGNQAWMEGALESADKLLMLF